jgi:hypothetical protein
MAKTAKKTAAKKVASKPEPLKVVSPSRERRLTERKVKQLVTSAPHFKFEQPGDEIACKVLSKIVPTEGEFIGKLIGWNVVNIDTGETVMIGNTHQIEKAFTTDEKGQELWVTGCHFLVVWNGKSGLGNGKTFNNFDIGVIED